MILRIYVNLVFAGQSFFERRCVCVCMCVCVCVCVLGWYIAIALRANVLGMFVSV